ncbi:unnamed protein product [Camellia sinensis]
MFLHPIPQLLWRLWLPKQSEQKKLNNCKRVLLLPQLSPRKAKLRCLSRVTERRSKRFLEIQKLRENKKEYDLKTAISLLKQMASTKFVETAEAHFRLNIDLKYNDQQLRATVNLPKGTGQMVRVAVLTQDTTKEKCADTSVPPRKSAASFFTQVCELRDWHMKKLVKGWRCSNLMKVEDEEAKLISIEKQENSISRILGLCSEFKCSTHSFICFAPTSTILGKPKELLKDDRKKLLLSSSGLYVVSVVHMFMSDVNEAYVD